MKPLLHPMFRTRLSLAFAALVALVCVQAAFVYWGAYRVNDYARHSRLASDILSELLDLSANKQRLRVWAMQRLMDADARPEVRERLIESMQRSAAVLEALAVQDATLWRELAERDGVAVPQEVHQLLGVSELLQENIRAVDARLKPLGPLAPGAEFAVLWGEINQVFDMAKGRDLREVLNGAIERQRRTVPVARAATERALAALWEKAIAMALITLAVAVAMALRLNRRLRQPLGRLIAGTQALQAGALDHRIATGSRDEFDHVAQSFNAMAQELQSHRAAADAARHGLELAVQERTRELSAAHETLQRLDERRRQLFADLGHELRTPATAVRGEAEIALRGSKEKPVSEYRQALERVIGGIDQMTGLIHDLMLVAKAEADQLVMTPTTTDLPALLSEAVDRARTLGAAHRIDVQLDLGDASRRPVRVHADADRLAQAIMIVLDNAVRYSTEGALVSVSLHSASAVATIEVRDAGIGIDENELALVFERFVRGRRARAHRADGTGIGLSIAQSIVHAHAGRIDVHSVALQGTTVRITLPEIATNAPEWAL